MGDEEWGSMSNPKQLKAGAEANLEAACELVRGPYRLLRSVGGGIDAFQGHDPLHLRGALAPALLPTVVGAVANILILVSPFHDVGITVED